MQLDTPGWEAGRGGRSSLTSERAKGETNEIMVEVWV